MTTIIQLNSEDASKVLWLIQREAASGPIYETYWEDLAREINSQIKQQQNGGFFQCAACVEHDGSILTTQASTVESERNLITRSEG